MMHPDPSERPSSTSIFDDPLLCPPDAKTKSQLNYELQKERKKNELLMRKLREMRKMIKSYQMAKTPREYSSTMSCHKSAASTHFTKDLLCCNSIGKRQHGPGSPLESDRELRSYSRAKKRASPDARCTGFRDRNKNIVSPIVTAGTALSHIRLTLPKFHIPNRHKPKTMDRLLLPHTHHTAPNT